ncbi:MAG: hypothetical protein AAGJ10_09765 [Bacteroidota bacterium]
MRYRWHLILPLLFVGTLVLAACEDELTPIVGTERPYSMYGLLTGESDTQTVLVVPIRDELDPGDPDAGIDAVVRSIDLTTGETRVWRDSLVVFANGNFGHVFFDLFRPTPTNDYRLEVTRSDGATSYAEVRIPADPVAVIEEPAAFNRLYTQEVVWSGIEEMIELNVDYQVRSVIPGSPLTTITIPYEGTYDDDKFRVRLALTEDRFTVFDQLPGGNGSLSAIRMRGFAVDQQWDPPGGRFDFETLVEPGLFSNVENGFGFVGASVEARVSWFLSNEIAQLVGYEAFVPDTTGDGTCDPEDIRCNGGETP